MGGFDAAHQGESKVTYFNVCNVSEEYQQARSHIPSKPCVVDVQPAGRRGSHIQGSRSRPHPKISESKFRWCMTLQQARGMRCDIDQ